MYCNANKMAPLEMATYLYKAGVTAVHCVTIVGIVETHLASNRGHLIWLEGTIVGAVEANLAAN